MTKDPGAERPTPSDVVGSRVRGLRRERGQSVAELAAAAAKAGHPELTRDAIYAIESGRRLAGRRRRTVSVDELLAFAETFDVPIGALLWPVVHVPSEEIPEGQEPAIERLDAIEQINRSLAALYGPVKRKEG